MSVSPDSEFDLIERYFSRLGVSSPDVALGIGDDCAIVSVPEGFDLCLSVDTMLEGRHFPSSSLGDKVAQRAFLAALSDLSAMGARGSHFTLSLSVPEINHPWLHAFSARLGELAEESRMMLVGGDTTRGPLQVTLQMHGLVRSGQARQRSQAKPGQVLVLTGELGASGGGLALLDVECPSETERGLIERYWLPPNRMQLALDFSSVDSACIDVSDGLLQDAGHLAKRSGVCLRIDLDRIPVAPGLVEKMPEKAMEMALSSGDDYELLFSMDINDLKVLQERYPAHRVSVIGDVVAGAGVVLTQEGQEISIEKKGYQHFE